MMKKIRNIFVLSIFAISTFFTLSYYFSTENIIHINKMRSSYSLTSINNLPLLKNDTNNIITYKDDLEEFKKKRKKRIWEKLISNENE